MEWVILTRRCLLVIESWIVALFGTTMSIGLIMIALAMRADSANDNSGKGNLIFLTILLSIAALESCTVYWTWKCIAKKLYPVGFSTALMQPKWKWGLRYPIAFWWSIKFSFGVLLLWMFHTGAAHKQDHDEPMGLGQSFVMVLVITHLIFGNLMLALGCFVSRETVAAVWKKRLMLELCMAAAASAISRMDLPTR